jgi:hypothetical protein
MSSCSFLCLFPNVAGSSVCDGGEYPWPLSSKRPSEAMKLPSIHELEKDLLTSIELENSSSLSPTRGSLANTTGENLDQRQHLPYPFEYSKKRSNSCPSSNHTSYPSSFSMAPLRNFQPHCIAQTAISNSDMSRLIEDFDMVYNPPINLSINL